MAKVKDVGVETCTVFVGDLPEKASMFWLKQTFSEYGEVRDAFIPKKRGIQGKVFAFVRMKDINQASEAIKTLNGVNYQNNKLLRESSYGKGKMETFTENITER